MTAHAWCATAGSVAHVFVSALDDSIHVGGDDGRHLARVRRLRTGEHLTAADGGGRWRSYAITDVGRDDLRAEATTDERQEPETAVELCIAFAPTKGGQPEHVVAALTELGVDAIQPVHCERSVVRWEGDRVGSAVARLVRVAREAAMLARRARLPAIAPPVGFAAIVEEPGLVVADAAGTARPTLPDLSGRRRVVLIGPEGGFSAAEQAVIEGRPRIALAPHVLSAATAPIAAAAVLRGAW